MMHTKETFYTGLVKLFIGLIVILLINGCGAGNGEGLDERGNLLTADAGDDTPADTGGDTGGDGGALSGNPNATLRWVQDNVFGGVCTQCHTGAGAPFVNWSTDLDTCSNVGRTSGEKGELLEIDSGNPDGSYVIWKLNGAGPNGEAIEGGQMPLSNPALTADTIQNISDWIADGTLGCDAASKASEPAFTPGSWKEVWNESLRVCTLCHSLTPSSPRCSSDLECPPQGLVLTEENYFGVVDGNTIAPFNPELSNLWKRVTENDPDRRMPLGYEPLKPSQLEIIRNWIENGAPFCPEGQICQ